MNRILLDIDGVELDAEVAKNILSSGDEYSNQTAELAQFIHKFKQEFRIKLQNSNFIQVVNSHSEGFELAVVDGASASKPHGGGALVAAVAYKSTLNDDRQRGTVESLSLPNGTNVDAFATLLRIHLEMLLLTKDNLDSDKLIVLDHSFWGIMQAVSRALATYKSERTRLKISHQNYENHAMLVAWKKLFKDCLSVNGSFISMIKNKQVISLSKTGISQFFTNLLTKSLTKKTNKELTIASNLNDRALLKHILEPGEFTTPRSIFKTEQDTQAGRKRSRFVTNFEPDDGYDPFQARQEVLDNYGVPKDLPENVEEDSLPEELEGYRLFVTYYRPFVWSKVYRIEFHELMLSNQDGTKDLSGRGERFQRVLASVRESINPETIEPPCQILADMRAKAAVSVAISVLPERTFYQLREQYREQPDILEIIDTLIAEERT